MHLGCGAVRIGESPRYVCPITVDMLLKHGDFVDRHGVMQLVFFLGKEQRGDVLQG